MQKTGMWYVLRYFIQFTWRRS